jgi:hypothetical protein
MSKYKQYEQSRQSFGINVLGTLIVEVLTHLPSIKRLRCFSTIKQPISPAVDTAKPVCPLANHWIDDHIATPMSKYKQYEQSRQSFGINVLGTLIGHGSV